MPVSRPFTVQVRRFTDRGSEFRFSAGSELILAHLNWIQTRYVRAILAGEDRDPAEPEPRGRIVVCAELHEDGTATIEVGDRGIFYVYTLAAGQVAYLLREFGSDRPPTVRGDTGPALVIMVSRG